MNTLSIIEKAARAAGDIALSYFHKESYITHKTSHQNLVTKADTSCQSLIKKIIVEELGKHNIPENEIGFIGEEKLETKGTKHLFIIDPIDGTNNFASGLDYFCVSIAHVEDGMMANSCIYWPTRDILYYAQAGSGAFKKMKQDSPIQLKVKDELLENSVLFTYLSSNEKIRKNSYGIFEKIIPAIRGVRLNGSICLDVVHLCDSENATNIVLSFRGFIWDIAAAYLILTESGGTLVDHQGKETHISFTDPSITYSFIAAHPTIAKQVSRLLLDTK